MAEGRPWYKVSQVSLSESNSVKKEPVNSTPSSPLCKPPTFSPMLSSGAKAPALSSPINSVVKTELPDIKNEPMAYIERALVKGEFPRDFNWPLRNWDPVAVQNPVKNETKTNHYIPKPLTEMELKLRYFPPRRHRGPPPDWHYIYTRDTHEPSDGARSWWNANVERALNKRRDAYLKTKLNDNAPVEVRMERLWSFEVAKDEARRVIAESKWKAIARDSGNTLDSNTINFGASTSRDTGGFAADRTLAIQDRLGPIQDRLGPIQDRLGPIQDRLGVIPVVGDVEDERNENSKELPIAEETERIYPDEIQFVPHDKGNVEVLTLEEEIEDAMSNSEDDSDDIRIDGEIGSNEVIFIQKKQGEVTFLAQVDGRFIKMNRKRKLCVTVSNTLNVKRNRVTTVGNDSGEELTNCTEQKEETDSSSVSNVFETVDVTKNHGGETAVGNLFGNENKLENHLSVESENTVPFKSRAVNTSVAEKEGYSGAQPLQGQITVDNLTENKSTKSVTINDIEVAALSDDEPEYIGSSSQKVTSKEKEDDIYEKPEGDGTIVPDKAEVSELPDAHLSCIKEDIIFLETVKSIHDGVRIVPAGGDLSRAFVKEDNNSDEFAKTDGMREAYDYENKKEESIQENNVEEDCNLKEGFVEIQCSVTSENKKK